MENNGGKNNTIILYNNTKYIFDDVLNYTKINIGTLDTYNCYTWLAGSPINYYNLNICRPEFTDGQLGHTLDMSMFNISNINNNGVLVDNSVNSDFITLFISNKYKSTSLVGTFGKPPNVSNSVYVVSSFTKNAFSYINIKTFIGTIDIQFKTINSDNILSAEVNTLRLVIIPRPSLIVNIPKLLKAELNQILPINLSIQNINNNNLNKPISINLWNPVEIISNKSLVSKIKLLLCLNNGEIINNDSMFTYESSSIFNKLNYGLQSNFLINFYSEYLDVYSKILQISYTNINSHVFLVNLEFEIIVCSDVSLNLDIVNNKLLSNENAIKNISLNLDIVNNKLLSNEIAIKDISLNFNNKLLSNESAIKDLLLKFNDKLLSDKIIIRDISRNLNILNNKLLSNESTIKELSSNLTKSNTRVLLNQININNNTNQINTFNSVQNQIINAINNLNYYFFKENAI